jgi:uncharacterized membrane protein (UPF0127 family)
LVSGAAEKFPTKTIKLGNKTLTVEVASTTKQQEQGLMMRTHLGDEDGMLFVFSNEETRFFWMKDTLIDLSIGYFNKDGKLIDVQEMKSGKGLADTALPTYASAQPAKYALEMNKGWFDKNKIKLGTKLKINP